MTWKIKQLKSLKLRKSVLIEGLPGIGNVGKVAVDFLIDELGAEKAYELSSFTLPHSVFINEHNLVELPKIEIYHKAHKGTDFLFLGGDVQPNDEVSCYAFCEEVLKLCREQGCADIITLGGIGLMNVPEKPKVYCTGNRRGAVAKYRKAKLQTDLYGVVGPIVGVSGLLLGMCGKKTDAVAFLAETYGHPLYLGIKGAKELVKVLNGQFRFGVKVGKLEKEIKEMEQDILRRTEELQNVGKLQKGVKEVNYIG